MATNIETKSNFSTTPSSKLIIKSTLPPNLTKRKPIKKISFSSLNLDNSNSFNGVTSEYLEANARISKFTLSDEKPSSYYSFSEINKRTSNFNKSTINFAQLPAYFLDERKASVNSKVEMHQKIMGIGENLREGVLNSIKKEYEERTRQTELEMEQILTRQKETQLETERSKFATKLDSIKAQLKSEYDNILKDKLIEIETYNQNIAKEQIELNKLEAKRHLEETVQKLKEQFEHEKKEAIEHALKSERQQSIQRLEEQRKANEIKMEELSKSWIDKLNQSLHELRTSLNKEAEKLRINSCEKVRMEKNIEIEHVKETYENKLDKWKVDYQMKLDEMSQLNVKQSTLQNENEQLRLFINELRQEFQNCIEHFSHLKKKEADFLFPLTDTLKEKLKM